MVDSLGFVLAAASAVFNGSFASVFKLPRVAAAELDPTLFQLYVSVGVFLSSFLVIPFLSYNPTLLDDPAAGTALAFEPLGLVAGSLFVLAITFSFAAVDRIGVALGQGVWGGIAILVSYAWGVFLFNDEIATPWLAVTSLLMLSCGVLAIAFCQSLGAMFDSPSSVAVAAQEPQNIQLQRSFQAEEGSPARETSASASPNSPTQSRMAAGFIFALAVGFSGGSILVPMKYVPKETSGLAFVVSLGIGAMIASPLVCAVKFAKKGAIPPLHLQETLLAGIFSGFVYNIGNVLQIIAIPMIGFGLAGPILQCALFVAGLWGIFVFGEIRGYAIIFFFTGGAVLITGAICLALSSGPPP